MPETPQKLQEESKEAILSPADTRDIPSKNWLDETEIIRITDFYKIPGEYS